MNLLDPELVQKGRRRAVGIPLIDIVFLLLIFFMTAGIRNDTAELPLALPEATGILPAAGQDDEVDWRKLRLEVAPRSRRPRYRLVSADGTLRFETGEAPALRQRLERLVAESDDKVLVAIDDAPGAMVEHVTRAIGACRQAGVEGVTLAARDE